MPDQRVVVKGYRDFLRACAKSDKDTRRIVREELRQAGDVIRRDSQERFQRFSARSAAGYKVVVRQRGVAVEQSLRKVTGKRPDWGALQMTKALIPARDAKEGEVERQFELAIDRIADRFEGHP